MGVLLQIMLCEFYEPEICLSRMHANANEEERELRCAE